LLLANRYGFPFKCSVAAYSLDWAQNATHVPVEAFFDIQGDPRKYQTYLATRPKSFEANAVALLIDVLRKSKGQFMKPGFWLHIVHLANADLLQDIKQAQDEGLSMLSITPTVAACTKTELLLLITSHSQHACRQMVDQQGSPPPLLLLMLPLMLLLPLLMLLLPLLMLMLLLMLPLLLLLLLPLLLLLLLLLPLVKASEML